MVIWCHVKNCRGQVDSMLDWIEHMNHVHPRQKELTQLISYLLIKERNFDPVSYPVYVPYKIEEPVTYPNNPWSPFYFTAPSTTSADTL